MGPVAQFVRIGAILAATGLSGCLFTTGDTRTITSAPSGAVVTIEAFGECETPCTVKLDGLRQVTVAKAGYKAQRFGVRPGDEPVHVILQLAAPTESIDATSLPTLE
ncbi:MAG: PEGA domain-containing protein [Pseudomonadota bacterium]